MANSLTKDGRMLSGSKVVTTAGTAERLIPVDQAGSVFWTRAFIVAKAANTGAIFVGGEDVASTTNAGLGATAGTNDTLEIVAVNWLHMDMSEVYLDAATDGEGVDFYLFK